MLKAHDLKLQSLCKKTDIIQGDIKNGFGEVMKELSSQKVDCATNRLELTKDNNEKFVTAKTFKLVTGIVVGIGGLALVLVKYFT